LNEGWSDEEQAVPAQMWAISKVAKAWRTLGRFLLRRNIKIQGIATLQPSRFRDP
jgi:hypothetical protein